VIPTDAFDLALLVGAKLGAAQVPYAIGGALAYGQYGIPRATNDVDINIFLEPSALGPALEVLRSAGLAFDSNAAIRDAMATGMFEAHIGPFRLDVFTPSVAFSWEAERTRRTFKIDGHEVCFLSPESLCVFKLLFFRGKDLVDLERLVTVMGSALDTAYVRRHIVEMMGEEDPRTSAWDKLVRENMP
jgi:hypothetical protein